MGTAPAYLPWVDPRFQIAWDGLSGGEQWQALAGFCSHVTETLSHHVMEWVEVAQAYTGIRKRLMECGYVEEAHVLSKVDMYRSLNFVLTAEFMDNGTIETDEHTGELYLAEILEDGLSGILRALRNPRLFDAVVKDIVRSQALERQGL